MRPGSDGWLHLYSVASCGERQRLAARLRRIISSRISTYCLRVANSRKMSADQRGNPGLRHQLAETGDVRSASLGCQSGHAVQAPHRTRDQRRTHLVVRLELDVANVVEREFQQALRLAAALLDDDTMVATAHDPARFEVAHDLRHAVEVGQHSPYLGLRCGYLHRNFDREQLAGLLDPHDEIAVQVATGRSDGRHRHRDKHEPKPRADRWRGPTVPHERFAGWCMRQRFRRRSSNPSSGTLHFDVTRRSACHMLVVRCGEHCSMLRVVVIALGCGVVVTAQASGADAADHPAARPVRRVYDPATAAIPTRSSRANAPRSVRARAQSMRESLSSPCPSTRTASA